MSNNPTTVPLHDFWANAAQNIDIPIQPGSTFIPDNWTRVLATGIQTLNDWDGKTIAEIGSGCGINILGMAKTYSDIKILGSEFKPEAVEASNILTEQHGLNATTRESDLLSAFSADELDNVFRFFACIPQVIAEKGVNLLDGDNSSHLCEESGTKWDDYCLPLQARFLQEANVKAPHAEIILNLAVRPPIEVLENLFTEHGRNVEILHSEIVPQHLGTCLQPFADIESQERGISTFYADPEGSEVITGTEARKRQVTALQNGADPQSAADNVYHGLIVAHASKLQHTL